VDRQPPVAPLGSDSAELWSLGRQALRSEGGDVPQPAPVDHLLPGAVPLHAFAVPPTAGLD
jgi:hypothetical protein